LFEYWSFGRLGERTVGLYVAGASGLRGGSRAVLRHARGSRALTASACWRLLWHLPRPGSGNGFVQGYISQLSGDEALIASSIQVWQVIELSVGARVLCLRNLTERVTNGSGGVAVGFLVCSEPPAFLRPGDHGIVSYMRPVDAS
jgi:hypothetical protein